MVLLHIEGAFVGIEEIQSDARAPGTNSMKLHTAAPNTFDMGQTAVIRTAAQQPRLVIGALRKRPTS